MSKNRKFNLHTGKGGAIQYACVLQETIESQILGRPLTDTEKLDIKEKVSNYDWKEGPYKIEDGFLKYLGNE